MNLLDRYVIRARAGRRVRRARGAGGARSAVPVRQPAGRHRHWHLHARSTPSGSCCSTCRSRSIELMPIGVLIGALLGLGTLARGSELTVMRAAGISVWRIAGSVAMAGILLMLVAVMCGEFLAPPMQDMAKRQKALSKFSNISFASHGGAWVRDGNLLINVMQQSGRAEFGGMRIYRAHPRSSAAIGGDRGHGARGSLTAAGSSSRYASTRFGGEVIEADTRGQPRVRLDRGRRLPRRSPVACRRQLETRVLWDLMQPPEGKRAGRRPPRSSRSGRASRAPPPSCSPPCSRCRSCSAACARPARGTHR